MFDDIPTSMQRLRTLADINQSTKAVRDEDYLQLKRDYDNLVNSVTALLTAINGGDFSPLNGSGSPEGIVEANYSLLYVDTVGGVLYFNDSYGSDTGWTAL